MKFYLLDNYNTFQRNINNYKNSVCLFLNTWDDWFQYCTLYSVRYVDNNGQEIYLGQTKIGERGLLGSNATEKSKRTASIPTVFNSLQENFFSLGQSDDYYDNIRSLGDDKRVIILKSLNDMSFNLQIYRKYKNENVTRVSLLREVGEFTIINQFNRIANGDVRLTEYNFFYQYPTNKIKDSPRLTFEVNPSSNPPSNVHVIIGRNAVGKTYLVKNLVNSVFNTSLDDKIVNGYLANTNRATYNQSQIFANVICVGFSPFDSFKKSNERGRIPYVFIGLNEDGEKKDQDSVAKSNLNYLATKFEKSIEVFAHNDKKKNLWIHLLSILETDPIFESINIKALLSDKREEIEKSEFNETCSQLFNKLSSGHKVVLLTITKLVETVVEKSLVILDEPENHLHPPLLSAFVRALSDLLKDRNGVAIISTHSPVILQEVPKNCVWKLSRQERIVQANRPELETFGQNIGTLTREVFGLEVRKSGFHKLLEESVEKHKNFESVVREYSGQLGDEAISLVKTLLRVKGYE